MTSRRAATRRYAYTGPLEETIPKIGTGNLRFLLLDLDRGLTADTSVQRYGFTMAEFEAQFAARLGACAEAPSYSTTRSSPDVRLPCMRHAASQIPITIEGPMRTTDIAPILARLFSELVNGAPSGGGAFVLNSGDAGLLHSLASISAAEASRSVNDGATIAAHVQHVRYGLSLMNEWARTGGNPFANARWDEAWKTSMVDAQAWDEIRNGLRDEAHQWLPTLESPREVSEIELTGMTASIAHLAYHLGAIRQINRDARGPREGTF